MTADGEPAGDGVATEPVVLGPGPPSGGPTEPTAPAGPGGSASTEPVALDFVGQWLAAVYRGAIDPERVEARRVGAALRLVIDRMVSTDAPASELAAAADQLEALAERLSEHRHGGIYRNYQRSYDDGHPPLFIDFAPLLGRSSALAPPLSVEVTDGQVIGRARFGNAYEGPPGCVHGGFIAACFDDVLGVVQSASGEPAMTGTLSVRYRAPTPLHTDVRLVGTLIGITGRKVMTRGELFVADDPMPAAEAEGLFITVGRGRFEELHNGQTRGDQTPN